jgi:hypothetical protein
MDIHKPKPVHGWRELLSEIGVIVIGVLIALAGEQAVEAYHWHEDVSEASATLDGQLQDAMFAATERTMISDCIDQQIASLQAIVAGRGRTPPLWLPINARPWSTSAWQSITASNVLGHMTIEDRLNYAGAFGMIDALRGWNREEFDLWSDIGTLEVPSVLSDTARDRLQSDLARVSKLNMVISVSSQQLIDPVHAAGITLNADNRQQIGEEQARGCRMPTVPRSS